jgi:putative hydrolase of the HAD superfamily
MKTFLIDADGVALKLHRYFSEIYSEMNNIPLEIINPFFKEKFFDCQRGKADLKESLVPYLEQWQWKGTVDEFVDLWCQSDVEGNQEVLDIVKIMRQKGNECYLTTDQEKYRSEYIAKNLPLTEYFDGAFYSWQLGYKKSEPEFWQAILQKLNIPPDQVIYWDDDEKNVEMARQLGIDAHHYKNVDEFKTTLHI